MKRENVESTHSARLLLVFLPAIIALIWIFYQGDRLSIATTSETIIFQGGIGIQVTSFGILLIAGLFSYVWGSKAWRDIRNADKWYKDGASLQILVLLFVGIVAIGLGAYYYPYSEEIVIDTSQQILSKENNYIMRSGGHEFQISFNEIDHVKFSIRGGVGEVIDTKIGFVEVVRSDGKIIVVRAVRNTETQHNLAKSIAEATGKTLIEGGRKRTV